MMVILSWLAPEDLRATADHLHKHLKGLQQMICYSYNCTDSMHHVHDVHDFEAS